jgi:DNA modification methylase
MLTTKHRLHQGDSRKMTAVGDETVDLTVSSPPYPMIQMWDSVFCSLNTEIETRLNRYDGRMAFDLMHRELDKVWCELHRVTKKGGIVCINIGDATRKIGDVFQVYSNHARISQKFTQLGFISLPTVLWRKQTNSPNKFMGSGMMPPNAYVTLEHEYILLFRKGDMRQFVTDKEKTRRKESSYFWEERNVWFSDIWELKGVRQLINNKNTRSRSAAFPFELAYRLINMHSIREDTVLDPFAGTGTTTLASIASSRNSIVYEIDRHFYEIITETIAKSKIKINGMLKKRIETHRLFVESYAKNKEIKHYNDNYRFPVITSQETKIILPFIIDIAASDDCTFVASYEDTSANTDHNIFYEDDELLSVKK